MTDVALWTPEECSVNFSTARASIQMPPGNAVNGTQKDVGDFCMKFFLLGDEAPLNLNIFQNIGDKSTWCNNILILLVYQRLLELLVIYSI